MPSIADVQRKLKAFDTFARHTDDITALKRKWHSLFRTDLTDLSAKSFVAHYREMRSKNTRSKHAKKSRRHARRQRGGVGAPLDYVMTPGANVPVYGRFPVEVDTDPGSIKDLDVYFQNALTFSCGKESAYWPQVPANMGSNQVGGRRGRRNTRKGKGSRKVNKSMRRGRKQRGGDIFNTIGNFFGKEYTAVTGTAPPSMEPLSRPFSTAPPNMFQNTYNSWTGQVPKYPGPPEPEKHTWDYHSNGTGQALKADMVTTITKDFNNMAQPSLYGSSSTPVAGSVPRMR